MATKAIIEIPVDDAQFREFYKLFTDYSGQLEEQPEAWRALNAAMGDAGKALEGHTVGASDALAGAAAQAAVIANALKNATTAQTDLGRATTHSGKAMSGLRLHAEGLSKAVASLGGWITRIAAFTGIGGLFAGFGIDRLAEGASDQYKSAARLGMTYGQLTSFDVNFGQFGDRSDLEAAANVPLNLKNQAALGQLGIKWEDAQKLSPVDLWYRELKATASIFQQDRARHFPAENDPRIILAKSLGIDISAARQVATLPHGSAILAADYAKYKSDTGRFGVPDDVLQAEQALSNALKDAKAQINSALVVALAPLAPEIGALAHAFADIITKVVGSKGFKDAVDGVVGALQSFDDYLGSPKFASDWKTFQDGVGVVANFLKPFIPTGPPVNPLDATAWKSTAGAKFTTKMWRDITSGNLSAVWDDVKAGFGYAVGGTPSEQAGKASTAATITNVARKMGIDPILAVATAMHESNLNPKAVGDSGHSVGLFQLNDQGEGAGMTREQREDAVFNTQTALKEFVQDQKLSSAAQMNTFSRFVRSQAKYNGLPIPSHAQLMALMGSPGVLAAIAQRPRDPYGYARDINARYLRMAPEPKPVPGPAPAKPVRTSMTPVHVQITNATGARVAVSVNAVAQG